MTAPRYTDLSSDDCAVIVDLCCAAGYPERASAFIRDGVHPDDVRQALAPPSAAAVPVPSAEPSPADALEAAIAQRLAG